MYIINWYLQQISNCVRSSSGRPTLVTYNSLTENTKIPSHKTNKKATEVKFEICYIMRGPTIYTPSITA